MFLVEKATSTCAHAKSVAQITKYDNLLAVSSCGAPLPYLVDCSGLYINLSSSVGWCSRRIMNKKLCGWLSFDSAGKGIAAWGYSKYLDVHRQKEKVMKTTRGMACCEVQTRDAVHIQSRGPDVAWINFSRVSFVATCRVWGERQGADNSYWQSDHPLG